MAKEIRFKARHSCPFLEFAKTFDREVYGYCSREFDLILILGEVDDEHVALGHKFFPNFDAWQITKVGKDSKMTYLRFPCECEDYYRGAPEGSITTQIEKAGGMLNYPIIYKDGWEHHKVICLTPTDESEVIKVIENLKKENLEELLEDSDEVDKPNSYIQSITDLGEHGLFKSMMVSVLDLIGDVTERQADVLISAYQNGYYDIPRRIRTQDIADQLGISRYGVEKVLRTAENKVIKSLIPYLYLKSEKPTKRSQKVY